MKNTLLNFKFLILVALILTLFPLRWSSAQEQSRLVIRVTEGRVEMVGEGSNLTPDQTSAVESSLQRRISKTPFSSSGEIEVVLKDESIAKLKSELARVDLNNQKAVDKAMEEAVENFAESSKKTSKNGSEGKKDDSRVLIGQNFHIQSGETVENVIAIGSNGIIEGQVQNLVVIGSEVELSPRAVVSGSLVTIGSQTKIASGAQVRGEEVRVGLPANLAGWLGAWQTEEGARRIGWLATLTWALGSFLASAALGGIFIFLFPRFARGSAEYFMNRKGVSLGVGLLGYLGFVPSLLLLVLTLIGILLVPAFIIFYGALVFIGHLVAALAVGWTLKPSWRHTGLRREFFAFALGLLLLKVIGLIPILGGIVFAVVTTMGFGAVLRMLFSRIRSRHQREPSAALGSPTDLAHA